MSSHEDPGRVGAPLLVFGGGNALGAFQAGAFEALVERGIAPRRVVGASIGGINGAIIAGNDPDQRLPRLRDFWQFAAEAPDWGEALATGWLGLSPSPLAFKTSAALRTLAAGRPGLFGPRPPSLWDLLRQRWSKPSLFETDLLPQTLRRFIDFDRLNAAALPLVVTAVDLDSGEDAVFDTRREPLTPDHLRASAAFMPLYPAVEIGGRLFADPGHSANLPLAAALAEPEDELRLAIAVDLVSQRGRRPESLGDAVKRALDLAFARQTAQAIRSLQFEFALRRPPRPAVLLHVVYEDQGEESAGKMLDYSRRSLEERWEAGRRTMAAALAALAAADPEPREGLSAYRFDGALTLYPAPR